MTGPREAVGRVQGAVGRLKILARTTERPVRKRGDESSDLPVWAAPQSHGRKSVVRGLLGHWKLTSPREHV